MVFSDKKSQRVERWELFFETECSSLLVKKAKIGCKIGACCVGIFLYADDIILLAPSVQALQSLFNICESEPNSLCMTLNLKKSDCAMEVQKCVCKCDGVWPRSQLGNVCQVPMSLLGEFVYI